MLTVDVRTVRVHQLTLRRQELYDRLEAVSYCWTTTCTVCVRVKQQTRRWLMGDKINDAAWTNCIYPGVPALGIPRWNAVSVGMELCWSHVVHTSDQQQPQLSFRSTLLSQTNKVRLRRPCVTFAWRFCVTFDERMSVRRPSVCTPVLPQSFLDFSEIWQVWRGRWVMQYNPIQG